MGRGGLRREKREEQRKGKGEIREFIDGISKNDHTNYLQIEQISKDKTREEMGRAKISRKKNQQWGVEFCREKCIFLHFETSNELQVIPE